MITPSAVLTPALAVTAAAYVAGNNVGGAIKLASALKDGVLTGKIQSLSLADHANQKAPVDILVFDSQPAAAIVDHAAMPALAVADSAKVIARISILAADYVTVGGTAVVSLNNLERLVQSATNGDLWIAIVTSGTPTYAAVTDLTVRIGVLRD